MAPTQTCFDNLIIDALEDRLNLKMITELEGASDPTAEGIAGLVRSGLLQDDPTFYIISILLHPANETWPHSIWDPRFAVGFQLPNAYEIGGQYPVGFWLKRFRAELQMYFDGEIVREVARTKANVVLARAIHAILTMSMNIPTDSFGETISNVQVTQAHISEGGGEGTYIWRGEILFEFLTQLSPT